MKIFQSIKLFFSSKTNETTYIYEIIRLVTLILLEALRRYNVFEHTLVYIPPVISTLILVLLYVCVLLSFTRLIKIADNRKIRLAKNGQTNNRWKPYDVLLGDFLAVIFNIDVTMEFEFTHNDIIYIIRVWVDTISGETEYEINGTSFPSYSDFEDYLLSAIHREERIFLNAIDEFNPEKYWNKIKNTRR